MVRCNAVCNVMDMAMAKIPSMALAMAMILSTALDDGTALWHDIVKPRNACKTSRESLVKPKHGACAVLEFRLASKQQCESFVEYKTPIGNNNTEYQ